MKNLTKLFCCNVALLLLFGCSEGSKEKVTKELSDNNTKVEVDAKDSEEEEMTNDASDTDAKIEVDETEKEANLNDSNSNNNSSTKEFNEEKNVSSDNKEPESSELSKYSSKQIEYARVWLQLGPNQEIDNLYVKQIPKGTPINPDDDSSIKYPEDVVQLSGSRLVDGVVTYSSNGDGTINVYDVPLRWYGGFLPPEDIDREKVQEEMRNIINNTEKIHIDPNYEEKVITVIKKIKNN